MSNHETILSSNDSASVARIHLEFEFSLAWCDFGLFERFGMLVPNQDRGDAIFSDFTDYIFWLILRMNVGQDAEHGVVGFDLGDPEVHGLRF